MGSSEGAPPPPLPGMASPYCYADPGAKCPRPAAAAAAAAEVADPNNNNGGDVLGDVLDSLLADAADPFEHISPTLGLFPGQPEPSPAPREPDAFAEFVLGPAPTDPNNNSGDKRSELPKAEPSPPPPSSSPPPPEEPPPPPRRADKYSLRPRAAPRLSACTTFSLGGRRGRRRGGEERASSPARRGGGGGGGGGGADGPGAGGPRPKPRPPPLSKYRRKTANARERDRMREINAAFESLRRAVPSLAAGPPLLEPGPGPAAAAGEKLTKITTLRLAMRYIAALSQLLQSPPAPPPPAPALTPPPPQGPALPPPPPAPAPSPLYPEPASVPSPALFPEFSLGTVLGPGPGPSPGLEAAFSAQDLDDLFS